VGVPGDGRSAAVSVTADFDESAACRRGTRRPTRCRSTSRWDSRRSSASCRARAGRSGSRRTVTARRATSSARAPAAWRGSSRTTGSPTRSRSRIIPSCPDMRLHGSMPALRRSISARRARCAGTMRSRTGSRACCCARRARPRRDDGSDEETQALQDARAAAQRPVRLSRRSRFQCTGAVLRGRRLPGVHARTTVAAAATAPRSWCGSGTTGAARTGTT
jgi:hypothetical protein